MILSIKCSDGSSSPLLSHRAPARAYQQRRYASDGKAANKKAVPGQKKQKAGVRVILTEDLPWGQKGEELQVPKGFARNFLFASGKAVHATIVNRKAYEEFAKVRFVGTFGSHFTPRQLFRIFQTFLMRPKGLVQCCGCPQHRIINFRGLQVALFVWQESVIVLGDLRTRC
jgi:hypothetical protein